MKRTSKASKTYFFLRKAEEQNRVFSLEDLSEATGWKLITVKTFRTKKWNRFLIDVRSGLTCKGVIELSEDVFLRLHSQRTDYSKDVLRPRFSPEIDGLIDKSRESALLAVQTYNNPLVTFRAYGYIIQMIIAFTSLFYVSLGNILQ